VNEDPVEGVIDDAIDETVHEAVEIGDGDVTWRFDRAFLESNWTCIFGAGCHGILPEMSADLHQGCCS